MSFATVNYNFWEFWEGYNLNTTTFGNQKVIFDGVEKLIYIVPGETLIYVKEDIYSNWKEWVQVRDNSKYEAALRTIGGDPVGNGLFAGDMYFLINGWKLVIREPVTISGIIYDNNPLESPFIIEPGGGVRNVVSNLAYAYNQTGIVPPSVEEIRQEMDTNSIKLSNINTKVQTLPTVEEIWNYSLRELTTMMDPADVWNFLLSSPLAQGSAGEKLKQALTTGNFIALK